MDVDELVFFGYGITVSCILLLLSALISSSEAALFSLSSKQLMQCIESGNIRKKRIVELLNKDSNRLLATIIIVNNLVNIGFIIFSNFMLWKYFGKNNVTSYVMMLYTIISTTLIVLFGELLPKMYAVRHNMKIAMHVSGIMKFFIIITKPLSIPLIKTGNFFGKNFTSEKHSISSKELDRALALTIESGNAKEEDILKGIANIGSLYTRQIMQPRTDIIAVEISKNFKTLLSLVKAHGFSRLPVFEGNIDSIKGIVYAKDLIPHTEKSTSFKWQALVRPCFFVPEIKKLDSLLLDFKEKHIHIAIVVDEYGGTSGMVTMENVIEKIIGSSPEVDNSDVSIYKKLGKNCYVFNAKIYISDLCKIIDMDPSIFDPIKGESESLAGLILEINGSLPKLGQEIRFKNFKFTIISADSKKIKRVNINISGK